jgi:hypothetical protein
VFMEICTYNSYLTANDLLFKKDRDQNSPVAAALNCAAASMALRHYSASSSSSLFLSAAAASRTSLSSRSRSVMCCPSPQHAAAGRPGPWPSLLETITKSRGCQQCFKNKIIKQG